MTTMHSTTTSEPTTRPAGRRLGRWAAVGALTLCLAGGGLGLLAGDSANTVAMPSVAAAQDESAGFTVDPVHSMVFFKVGHLGVARNYGRFNDISGTYDIDLENPDDSFVDIEIATESVDTGNERRDNHLRSPDFFDAKQFPKATFTSDKVEVIDAGRNKVRVSGTMRMLGESRPVTAEVTKIGEAETRQGYKQGIEAIFTIKRSDFGMTKYLEGNAIGDEITVHVGLEGARG